MRGSDDLAAVAMNALAVQPASDATACAARYGGAELHTAEQQREQQREEHLAEFGRRLATALQQMAARAIICRSG